MNCPATFFILCLSTERPRKSKNRLKRNRSSQKTWIVKLAVLSFQTSTLLKWTLIGFFCCDKYLFNCLTFLPSCPDWGQKLHGEPVRNWPWVENWWPYCVLCVVCVRVKISASASTCQIVSATIKASLLMSTRYDSILSIWHTGE